LGYINENNLNIKAGFIHVPLLKSQSPDGMNLQDMIKAITIAIEESLDSIYIHSYSEI
jgi:pyrrolidone-carboxylate peptidase